MIVLPGLASNNSGLEKGSERRGAARYPFTAAAEVVEVRSQARVAGRSSDLGVGGCYIDTLSPFGVGAGVRVRLERDVDVFEAEATVVYAHVSMGMGLSFTKVEPQHQSVLRKWIAELSGEPMVEPEAPVMGSGAETRIEILKLHGFLSELVNLMVRKKTISENEAEELLRQLFR